jgi:U4/U6 small nuclear ribonucleoprotein PRP4
MEIDRIQEGIDYDKYLEESKDYQFVGSQFADERGCTKGSLSPNDEFYAVSGNSGTSTVFKVENLKKQFTLKGHTDRVNCINFHPEALISLPPIAPNIATCSSDTTVKLWTFNSEWEDQKSVTYKGHEERVNNVEFHPTGRFIASSSHDNTWRLWDVEYKKELLVQDGHVTHVYPISFQTDGALLASGDLAGIGIIWDLRSGRSIMTLQGHVKRMISIKFSKNCYQVASGSDDNTVKIWDLRKKSCIYTVPAHSKTVSDICFENVDAKFMLTCSYDSSFKMWNNRDWSMVRKFTSNSDCKFTSISLTKDNKHILTTSLDRTIRFWTLQRREVKNTQENETINNN